MLTLLCLCVSLQTGMTLTYEPAVMQNGYVSHTHTLVRTDERERQEERLSLPVCFAYRKSLTSCFLCLSPNKTSRPIRDHFLTALIIYRSSSIAPPTGHTELLIFQSCRCLCRFYSSPYSITTNRMIAHASITPFITASPMSTYQVRVT